LLLVTHEFVLFFKLLDEVGFFAFPLRGGLSLGVFELHNVLGNFGLESDDFFAVFLFFTAHFGDGVF
jgi:hypothetical protein